MENLDLDLNNYTLDDLLNLFKLDYNFLEENFYFHHQSSIYLPMAFHPLREYPSLF